MKYIVIMETRHGGGGFCFLGKRGLTFMRQSATEFSTKKAAKQAAAKVKNPELLQRPFVIPTLYVPYVRVQPGTSAEKMAKLDQQMETIIHDWAVNGMK